MHNQKNKRKISLSQYDTRGAAVKDVSLITCQQMTQRAVIGCVELKARLQKNK